MEEGREKGRTGKYDAAAVFTVVVVVIFVVVAARICITRASRDQHVKNLSIDHLRVGVRNHVIQP